jgi:hypothetical protein
VNKLLNLALTLAVAGTLAGCGGGSDPELVAASNATLAASPTVTSAVANQSFAFASGVADFGTTAATTVAFTSTSTTPEFSIASGGDVATGTTTFGSCIFTITASTFPASSPLATGKTITVHPCNITVNTAGQALSTPAETRSVALVLGAAASTGVAVTVDITEGGAITLNGKSAGTVTLTPVTGA